MTQPRNGPLQHGCCHWTSSGHGLFQNIAHVIFAGSIFDGFQSKKSVTARLPNYGLISQRQVWLSDLKVLGLIFF